jgi:hypothetical protein
MLESGFVQYHRNRNILLKVRTSCGAITVDLRLCTSQFVTVDLVTADFAESVRGGCAVVGLWIRFLIWRWAGVLGQPGVL